MKQNKILDIVIIILLFANIAIIFASLTTEKEPIKLNIEISIPQLNEQLDQDAGRVEAFKTTAYCPCKKCNGKWSGGITASGNKAKSHHTIAADLDVLPIGTQVLIDGKSYIVEDTGGAVKGNHIDIFFDTHQEALDYGVQYKEVVILE